MKLKLIVTTLVVLGFAGSSLAAVKNVTPTVDDKVTKANAVLNQNTVVNDVCGFNWADRITIGGLLNTDLVWSNRNPAFDKGAFTKDGDSTDLFINNANLLVDAKVNSWVNVHTNFMYADSPFKKVTFNGLSTDYILAQYASVLNYLQNPTQDLVVPNVPKTWNVSRSNELTVDEAFVDIANFCDNPFFVRVGKQYVPFGTYTNYPLIVPMTQFMSQINQTAITAGVITDFGLYFDAYAFKGPTSETDEHNVLIRNFGAKLGYHGDLSPFTLNTTKYDVDVAWVRNMLDADYMSNTIDNARALGFVPMGILAQNIDRVNGVSVHADLSYAAWDFSANYVTALRDIIPNRGLVAFIGYNESSRLWAADVNASYAFRTMDHASKVGVSYQFSGDGQFTSDFFPPEVLSFPKNRIMADYTFNLFKNTDLTVAAAHQNGYEYQSGPNIGSRVVTVNGIPYTTPGINVFDLLHGSSVTGKPSSDLIMARLSVKI